MKIPSGVHPVLAESAEAAWTAYRDAMARYSREERLSTSGIGGDGTPTYFLDEVVERPVLEVFEKHGVNVLSEEIGWIDRGSSETIVVDPLDGTANAAAGVPLACFCAARVVDGVAVEGLALWLDGNRIWWAKNDTTIKNTTTKRATLDGAAVSMLRPRPETFDAWCRVARRIDRVRVLGSSVLEACLVADGAIDAFCDAGGDIHRIVDLAAVDLIVKAAGGVLIDLHGRALTFEPDLSLRWSGIVAATPQLAEELRSELLRSN